MENYQWGNRISLALRNNISIYQDKSKKMSALTEHKKISNRWSVWNVRRHLVNLLNRLETIIKPKDPPGLNLMGDRDIEWSWVLSHINKGPGKALDLGSGWSLLLSLTAALRGFEVMALDRNLYEHPFIAKGVTLKQSDIITDSLPGDNFDLIIACSTMEHIGLPDRYGNQFLFPDADLETMQKLRNSIKPTGSFILTIPVGVDAIFIPFHRIYGETRLSKLLWGWRIKEECYWLKRPNDAWESVSRSEALAFTGNERVYGIGCFEIMKELE
jgi:hypothetical protein